MSDLLPESFPVPEISRALCQDRSHAILIVDTAEAETLAEAIVHALPGTTRVEIVHLAGRDSAWAMRRLSSPSGANFDGAVAEELEIRARLELELLVKLNASRVLVIPDALRADTEVLRQLAALGAACGNVLRLALIAERAGAGEPDPAAQLVRALGTGAAKIDTSRPEPPRDTPAPTMPTPPIVPRIGNDTRARRARPIAVRSLRSSRQRRSGLAVGIARMLAAFALAAPALIWATSRPPPEPQLRVGVAKHASPVAAAPGIGPPSPPTATVAAALVVAEPVSAPAPPPEPLPATLPATLPELLPELLPEPLPETLPEPTAAARAHRVRTVGVSLNAWPYAEIDVDGRAVGPTPIADLPLAVGPHTVRATYPDGRVVVQELEVDRFQNHFRLR